MKTILVPTDFSKAAGNAAEYAISFAKIIKAKVLLFHAYHLPNPVSKGPVIMITTAELQKRNELLLKGEAARLKKKCGIEVKYLAKMGLAVDEILEEERNASMIIMGMKGAGKLSEALMGSITTATLRKSKIPVLVIPEEVKYKNPEKIVLACDYDPRTDLQTLNALKDLMKTFGSKIYVVNVKEKKESLSMEKMLGTKLEGKLCDVQHVYCFREKEDIVDGINEFVKGHNADMVAIIPHHYNLMERLFHKSISKKMAFHTHVPLLALPDNHKSISAYFL
jgi:nucleotide-binding universal stress UspA family protein